MAGVGVPAGQLPREVRERVDFVGLQLKNRVQPLFKYNRADDAVEVLLLPGDAVDVQQLRESLNMRGLSPSSDLVVFAQRDTLGLRLCPRFFRDPGETRRARLARENQVLAMGGDDLLRLTKTALTGARDVAKHMYVHLPVSWRFTAKEVVGESESESRVLLQMSSDSRGDLEDETPLTARGITTACETGPGRRVDSCDVTLSPEGKLLLSFECSFPRRSRAGDERDSKKFVDEGL